jgi:transcriptional regulator with XRE-family HTH domain
MAMAGRDIRFGLVLRQLLNERFRGRRKDFADSIHVSESALSQYVRGKATPSLTVLVSIARALDVSLDYLVLGIEPEPPASNYTGLVTYVEEAIAQTHVRTATLRDFVGRVGSTLSEEIESTAKRLLVENAAAVIGGGLTAAEVRVLESVSKHIRIATVDLDVDVLLVPDEPTAREDPDSDEAEHEGVAPRSFHPVISHNVRRGSEYDYVIPEGSTWRRTAKRLRDAVGASEGLTNAQADRRIRFFESTRALVPGYVIYRLDRSLVATKTERLLDRISDFVDEESGLVALAEPTSRQSQYYSLIDPRHHRLLLAEHNTMTDRPRLVFD